MHPVGETFCPIIERIPPFFGISRIKRSRNHLNLDFLGFLLLNLRLSQGERGLSLPLKLILLERFDHLFSYSCFSLICYSWEPSSSFFSMRVSIHPLIPHFIFLSKSFILHFVLHFPQNLSILPKEQLISCVNVF